MDGLKITYRGIEVPEFFHVHISANHEFDLWTDGVDAVFDRETVDPEVTTERVPRVFERPEDIPSDVKKVRESGGWIAERVSGDTWRYVEDSAGRKMDGHNWPSEYWDKCWPLTEILEDKRTPRVFNTDESAHIPADVKKLRTANGDIVVRCDRSGWTYQDVSPHPHGWTIFDPEERPMTEILEG